MLVVGRAWAGRRVLGLGLWGNGRGCGPALASRPPSPLRLGLSPPLPAFGHRQPGCVLSLRQTPLACPTPSDSPLPWPPATAVSWQEGAQGCAEATEPGVQGLPARRVWSGGLPVSVPGLAGRQGPVAGTCWASPSPLAFGPFLSSHREVSGLTANEKGQPLAGGRPGSEGSGRGPLGHSPPA